MLINVIIVAVVVIAFVVILRGYIARGGKGDCCGGADVVRTRGPKDRDESHYAHVYDVEVRGMSCENCAKRIASAFNGHEGTMATVDLAAGIAHVRTKQAATEDELKRIVKNEGYGVGAIKEL